ncbi:hypothetical protein [Marinobacterium lacunae]|uniref:hypothetical protein n=1 Tax=Marinobacterium lacunae TaxID=1232683 RepID=UPI00056925D3|nr:hypothetical protein [Marinobacterium lacunae]
MIEKLIAPIVVGIVVGFVLLFGDDVKQLFLPDYEVTYQTFDSNKVLGSEDVGRKEIQILGKNVSDVYLTQVKIINTGKNAIEDFEILFDISAIEKPDLYRVFYITQPPKMFGDVVFSDFGKGLSKKIDLIKFIEGNSLVVSFISSVQLDLDVVANNAGVRIKKFTETPSVNEHAYVAIISALSVIVGRLLIDILFLLFSIFRNRSSK